MVRPFRKKNLLLAGVFAVVMAIFFNVRVNALGSNAHVEMIYTSDLPLSRITSTLFSYREKQKYGLIDMQGKQLLPAVYDSLEVRLAYADKPDYSPDYNKVVLVLKSGNMTAVADARGKLILEPQAIGAVGAYADGWLTLQDAASVRGVSPETRTTYIDSTGKVVLELPKGLYASGFHSGLATVTDGTKYGFLNKQGEFVVALQYEYAGLMVNGVAVVKMGGKYGCIDSTGKVIAPFEYDEIVEYPTEDGLMRVYKRFEAGYKAGYIDMTGRLVIPCEFDWIASDFHEGLAYVLKDPVSGCIDTTGTMVFPIPRDCSLGDFHNGIAVVTRTTYAQDLDRFIYRCAYINRDGAYITDFEWERVEAFYRDYALVRRDGLWGVLDRTGHVTLEPRFASMPKLYEGYLSVADGINAYSLVSITGEKLLSCQLFEDGNETLPEDGNHVIKQDGKWHIIRILPVNTQEFTGASAWALPELEAARKLGLTTPVERLAYNTPITREKFCELAVVMVGQLSQLETTEVLPSPFTDTSNPAILRAFELGIVKGTSDTTFTPDAPVTREQIAAMLARALAAAGRQPEAGTPVVFADDEQISVWAKSDVTAITKSGAIKGYEDNTFRPQAYCTIEQAVIIVYRLIRNR